MDPVYIIGTVASVTVHFEWVGAVLCTVHAHRLGQCVDETITICQLFDP